ncbi:MAG TPA: helicase C-terminal domain-containing protein [Candidatus Acidoferrales bacterium]|nr:helicase C-terminal domain-containing protein [Candidatus Acidoferrales bacterium]
MSTPGRPEALVAFDLEATGLSPKTDRVLEIGAVRYDSELRRTGQLDLVVDPGIPIPLAIQRLVGLGPDDVRGAPTPLEGMAQLADFAEGAVLIAHGGAFDLQFCRALQPEAFRNRLVFDTLDLARVLLPTAFSHSLVFLSGLLELRHERPHRALSDAEATGALFALLATAAERLPTGVLAEIRRVARQVRGPLQEFFDGVVLGHGNAPRTSAPGNGGPQPIAAPDEPSRRRFEELQSLPLDQATAQVLGADGLLESAGTFEYREGQVEMGRAVAQALDRRRRLLVEAGTGVGKSLAYLVPLALWAARTGERGVVATHTVNLQEQLADRDLPAVARLVPTPLAVAVLKGRNHYVSLRRWQRFLARPDGDSPRDAVDAIRFKLKILVWLAESRTGDRAELHLAAEEEPFWRSIASDTDDCLGTYCMNWASRRCHMVAARAAAADAAIVVTNHSLLLAASERQGQVLPSYSALVVDEAHHLEASATEQLGSRARGSDLTLVLDRLPARPESPVGEALVRCREAGQRVFGDAKGLLAEMLGGEHAGNGRIGLTPEVRDDSRFGTVLRAGRHAVTVLLAAAATLEQSRDTGALQHELLPQPGAMSDEVNLAAAALAGIASTIDHVICRPRPGYVTWLEMRAEQSELHEAPVSVAEPLRELIFDQVESAVLTSATLSVAGSFDFIRGRTGIGEGAEELSLSSPFDYLSQALCVLPESIPPYDDPLHDNAIAELIAGIAERLGGRTLALFTGYGPLRRVHALLHDRMEAHGVAMLGQGIDGTRRQILNSFLSDPRTVLLGTSSFWEGVDIPGARLQCVLIDKLPFAVPTDPLVRARTDGLRDPFTQYILPMAVIRLRQGFGRLIRGSGDRGAVVLCDERLSTREYGDVFLRALPPAGVARAGADEVPMLIERFIRGGAVPEAVGQSRSGD